MQGQVGIGSAQIPPKQGIYESSDKCSARLGDRIQVGERVFHYGKVVDDTNRGVLVGPDQSANCVAESENYVITPVAAGSTTLTITGANMASKAKNAFAGGLLHLTSDTGEGYTLGIKSNKASVSTALELTLYDPLVVDIVSEETDIAITGNMFNNLKIVDSTDKIPSGVLPISIDTSEEPYGWIQTGGRCAVLNSGGVSAGEIVVAHTAGDVIVMSAFTAPIVGYCVQSGRTGEHCVIFLQIKQ